MSWQGMLTGAREAFFKAMLNGYAAGFKGESISGMPFEKQIALNVDNYHVIDRWGMSKRGWSYGTTTIIDFDPSGHQTPAWFMSYGGRYEKAHIPFLKRALMQNYKKGNFTGGRGPSLMTDLDFMLEGNSPIYVNWATGDFSRFSGHEEIRTCDGDSPLGWHDYWGMALI